jgi:hypothetical protein
MLLLNINSTLCIILWKALYSFLGCMPSIFVKICSTPECMAVIHMLLIQILFLSITTPK